MSTYIWGFGEGVGKRWRGGGGGGSGGDGNELLSDTVHSHVYTGTAVPVNPFPALKALGQVVVVSR